MASFSRRSELALDTNAITRALEAQSEGHEPCLSLVESNPTRVGLSPSAEELGSRLVDAESALYEPDPFGHPRARLAVSRDLSARGFAVPPEHVVLTASTSEAYAFLFKLLCDPGDRVLVPAPSYPLFEVLARYEGVELSPYELAYDGEWHLGHAELARAASRGAKAVIVVHPNNPTGHFLKRAELDALEALGLPIVSDEVFADYAFGADPARAESALEAASETLVFRLGGLSKALALPQLKLSWTAVMGPPALRDAALARLTHIADAFLSPATPVQLALPRLLELAPAVQARVRKRCAENLELLGGTLLDSAASVLRVEGGWYAIVRLPAVLDEERWVLTLLERDRVLVQPGYFYELSHGAHVVLSLITPEATFAEGVRRLAARVRAVCHSPST